MNLPSGDRIGWYDLASERHQLDQPAFGAAFWQAVSEYRQSPATPAAPATPAGPGSRMAGTPPGRPLNLVPSPTPVPAERPPPEPPPAEPPPAEPPPERDLADNLPGANVAARAAQLRARRPLANRLARLVGARTSDRAWAVGAAGERRTGKTLARLPDGWYVLHAVQLGTRGTDVDHLVFGPGGVFTINSKHHRGAQVEVGAKAVFVQGRARPYIDAARHEATRVARALSTAAGYPVPVRPIVAIVGARRVRRWRAREPWSVKVLPRRALPRYLRWRGHQLTGEQPAELYDLARRPATWLRA